jgi:nicotinate-nucleotide adenylyltransferase
MTGSGHTMRIGIFGGTFDPPQIGHIFAAHQAFLSHELDTVFFVPTGESWHKGEESLPHNRAEMVKLAISNLSWAQFSDCDLLREGPTYSIDTLTEFRSNFPTAELFFIMGDDAFSQIHTWKSWQHFPELAQFIVVSRRGDTLEIPEILSASVNLLEISAVPISSTQCREMIRRGEPVTQFIPADVIDYIQKNQLYRSIA